jgi:large subunit ribosomal protein L29
MDIVQLRTMDEAALRKQLDDFYQELFNLRFQAAGGQLKNFNRSTAVKRDIARIQTILRERVNAGKEAKAQ